MQQRWYPNAIQTIYPRFPTGGFRDTLNRKAVWHTTQGHDNVLEFYGQSGGIPHFTILTTGQVHQHYPCDQFSRALRNLPGGVETNTDGAIQVEIVGFAGTEHTNAQLRSIYNLTRWLTDQLHVSPAFPMGRLSKPYTKATQAQWDNGRGHFAHGQVPENDHTDPDMTDRTWKVLEAAVQGHPLVINYTAIQERQRQLWLAGFAKPPYTQRVYVNIDEWADGIDGPETQRAQAAYDKSIAPTAAQQPALAPVQAPTFTKAEANELCDLIDELAEVGARFRAWLNK